MSLKKWTIFNAILITIALGLSIVYQNIFHLCLFALFSFCWLIRQHKDQFFTAQGPFLGSYANQITLFRLFLILFTALFCLSQPPIVLFFLFGFTIFLDGIDGYLAREFQQESELGALLDKTTDAFFVLLLTIILVQKFAVPFWFIGVGYLHYGYELLMQLLGWTTLKIPRNPIGKWVAVILFLSLLSPFIFSSTLYLPIIYISSFFIGISFSWSFLAKWRVSIKA